MADEIRGGRENFTIRKMLPEDASAVHEILQKAPEAADWTEGAIRSSLDSKQTLALVSESDQEIVGYVSGARVADEAEILNLAVKPPYRRRGIASSLVLQILADLHPHDVQRIYLEVRESNVGAIKFYAGLGFRQVGKRKKYYSEPEEDALLLEWHGTQNNPQIGTR